MWFDEASGQAFWAPPFALESWAQKRQPSCELQCRSSGAWAVCRARWGLGGQAQGRWLLGRGVGAGQAVGSSGAKGLGLGGDGSVLVGRVRFQGCFIPQVCASSPPFCQHGRLSHTAWPCPVNPCLSFMAWLLPLVHQLRLGCGISGDGGERAGAGAALGLGSQAVEGPDTFPRHPAPQATCSVHTGQSYPRWDARLPEHGSGMHETPRLGAARQCGNSPVPGAPVRLRQL